MLTLAASVLAAYIILLPKPQLGVADECLTLPPISSPAPVSLVDSDQKPLDLVVFGATGFTGKLVTRYLSTRPGTTQKWAIAGRSDDRLNALRDELGTAQPPPRSSTRTTVPRGMKRETRCLW